MDSQEQLDILVSIHPTFAGKILAGQKSVELRRRFPVRTASRLLIYSCSPVSAVVGLAQIKAVLQLPIRQIWCQYGKAACISKEDFDAYFYGLQTGFVVVLEEIRSIRRKLSAKGLQRRFGIVPPQSYRYVSRECTAYFENGRVQAPHRHERDNRVGRPTAGSKIIG
jgi:predicted transcriptional regulator